MTVLFGMDWRYPGNGETIDGRFVVGNHRTDHSGESAAAKTSRTQAYQRPGYTDGDSFRAEDRNRLGGPAAGTGLGQWHDVLAAAARLAKSWRLGKTPQRVARAPACRRPDRLVASRGRFEQRAGSFWGLQTGRNPTDRGKAGSKHHLLTDAQGIPLCVQLTAANVNDTCQLQPLLAAVPAVRGKVGRPRRRPDLVQGDRAYGSAAHSRWLRRLGITDQLARCRQPHDSGLGKTRWVVERSLSWLHQFRRLRVRYERRADIHEAFLTLGCALICYRTLENSFC